MPAIMARMLWGTFNLARSAQRIETIFTVVDILPPEDIEVCRKLAQSHGGRLRIRKYIE